MRLRPSSPCRGQRGAVLVWVAAFFLVLLMFIALGVDAAKLMVTRTQLHNAADAAALAGASAIDARTGAIVDSLARSRACETAALNKAFENSVTPVVINPNTDVVVDQDNKTVTVTTHRDDTNGAPMIAHFAHLVGLGHVGAIATATAKVDYAGAVWKRVIPLAFEPDSAITPGCEHEYVLKEGGGAGSNGQYGGMQFPSCPDGACPANGGASEFSCLLDNGYDCPVYVGQCYPPKTGNVSGPVRSAIRSRFERDTDRRQGICYEEYAGNGARVVIVPITTSASGPGHSGCYVVLSFGSFFIKSIPGSGTESVIIGEFIETVTSGGQGGSSGTAYAIRLIR